MNDVISLDDGIKEELSLLDADLAASAIPLSQRPMIAAKYISELVVEISEGGKTFKPDFESKDKASERVFFYLWRAANKWYLQRYGDAFYAGSNKQVAGLAIIWGNPFIVEIPLTISKPDEPGKTAWMHFPLSVHEEEKPTDWLVSPPNLSTLTSEQLEEVNNNCANVARKIRPLFNKLIGVGKEDRIFDGLMSKVWSHVEGAATKLFPMQGSSYNSSVYWEIQMACECVFKALLYKNASDFPKTHNLSTLYGLADNFMVDFDDSHLSLIPPWEKMLDYRYGKISLRDILEYNKCYEAMLQIVDMVVRPMVLLWLREAAIKIAYDPF